jgi:hypothetical protein
MSATSEDLARSTVREYLDTAEHHAEQALKVANRGEAIMSQCMILAAKLIRENDL